MAQTPPPPPPWLVACGPWIQLAAAVVPMVLSAVLVSSWQEEQKLRTSMREDIIKINQTLLMICDDIKKQDGTDDRQDEAIAQLRVQMAQIRLLPAAR